MGRDRDSDHPEPEFTWDDLCRLVDAPGRSDAWREAGRWALDIVSRVLGSDWPERSLHQHGRLPLPLESIGSHTLGLIALIELACRLELASSASGYADLRKDLARDRRVERALHSSLQLEVVGLAARADWEVSLEPQLSGASGPADLLLRSPAGALVVEAAVVLQSDAAVAEKRRSSEVHDRLMVAGLKADATVAGHLSQLPDETELKRMEAWIGSVDAETVNHRRGLSSQLVVGPRDARLGGLSSANSPEPLLNRVESVVERKVHRMRDSHARWLRLTVLNGLWPFTPWGRSPMSTEKVEALAEVLRRIPGIPTIDGVVMSSAAGLHTGDLDGAKVHVDGAFGASVAIGPLRARETIAVAINETGIPALAGWETLVSSEADWCAWALGVYGLPTLDQILGQDGGSVSPASCDG